MATDAPIRELATKMLVDAQLRAAATTFFRAAAEESIQAAPIKGAYVSATLYDDPLERPFRDVDVLVRWRDIRRVTAMARRRGFGLVFDSKQLGCVNVVIPPGIPIDVRCSIGPPGLSPLTGSRALDRSRRCVDARICDAPFLALDKHDHLMLLMVDAVLDKLSTRPHLRRADLGRALRRWVSSSERFAMDASRARLRVVAHVVLSWLADHGDPLALQLALELKPLPWFPERIATWLRADRVFEEAPDGMRARIAARTLADSPPRALAALALGAVGWAAYISRHGLRPDGWRTRFRSGPEE